MESRQKFVASRRCLHVIDDTHHSHFFLVSFPLHFFYIMHTRSVLKWSRTLTWSVRRDISLYVYVYIYIYIYIHTFIHLYTSQLRYTWQFAIAISSSRFSFSFPSSSMSICMKIDVHTHIHIDYRCACWVREMREFSCYYCLSLPVTAGNKIF
jgi:hypothetical protein